MKNIEAFQKKKIYAIGNALGLVENGNDNDDLHLLIGGITGKDSVKVLTYTEANAVISHLEQLQKNSKGAPPKRTTHKTYTSVPGGITIGQQRKVWALMYELEKYDKEPSTASLGDRVAGIIKNSLHLDGTAKNPMAWLDFHTGEKLIETIKRYIESAKKGCGVDGT